jgi:hypothetical protein
MNAPLHHPIKEAAAAVSELPRRWTAVIQPMMGLWEPVIVEGRALVYGDCGLAWAVSTGYPGASTIFVGWSTVRPTLEAIRAAANPPRETCPPVSFDIEALDGGHDQKSAFWAWRPA